MKSAILACVALLLASPLYAVPIVPPMPHCGCTLTEIQPEAHVNVPDPGYAATLSAGELAELKRIDDLHEPMPEPSLWVWICLPGVKVPGMPKTPDFPMGGGGSGSGGSGGGGGQPRGGAGDSPVPGPELLGLMAFGLVAVVRRWRS